MTLAQPLLMSSNMKLDGKVLVAVAMMFGAVATTGCNKASSAPSQPEITPVVLTPEDPLAGSAAPSASADAPVAAGSAAPSASADAPVAPAANGAAPAISDKLTMVASSAARQPAPPALREEAPGAAPSAHHVWQRGHWRYDMPRAAYVWAPGYWEDTTVYALTAPPPAIHEDPGYAPSDEYFYAPGYWRYSGREYVWVYGHWTLRRDAAYYYRPQWVRVNGRWEHRVERWNATRVAAWERTHRHHDGRHVPRSHEVRHPAGYRYAAGGHHPARPHVAAPHGHPAPQHHPRAAVHAPPARPAVRHAPAYNHVPARHAPAAGHHAPARHAPAARRGRG